MRISRFAFPLRIGAALPVLSTLSARVVLFFRSLDGRASRPLLSTLSARVLRLGTTTLLCVFVWIIPASRSTLWLRVVRCRRTGEVLRDTRSALVFGGDDAFSRALPDRVDVTTILRVSKLHLGL